MNDDRFLGHLSIALAGMGVAIAFLAASLFLAALTKFLG